MQSDARPAVVAALGPTNTGKTHRAVERMLEHQTGMLGLPLRLLAREVYDRVSARVGERAVALVTGEEKRWPAGARYLVCTVEAMPMDHTTEFVAVDEIQLAAHPQRGHVFTERLLHARGTRETWFMGAETLRPLIDALVPGVEHRAHPRFSALTGGGVATLGSLPRRSAVVAFSMARVYEIAERLRARRGGAAVVLGALSPRARNAQVALYQAGEVDYLVATDAIGMGLNLNVDHVAFADLRKFDGHVARDLSIAELAQVAGRAGRHTNDGTFGSLAPTPALPRAVTRAIESHRFDAERVLQWRNPELDCSSLDALLASLRAPPRRAGLRLIDRADDSDTLTEVTKRDAVRALATDERRVKLLWELCQIPDYRQVTALHHASLIADLFERLAREDRRLDPDWLAGRVARLDDVEGDIDTLLMRMAAVRTWTYVTSHRAWVDDGESWQARTHAIEDRLSDALHDLLVERFVARRGGRRATSIPNEHPLSRLAELRQAWFGDGPAAEHWLEALCEAPHEAFRVDRSGAIFSGERRLGRFVAGSDRLHPAVRVEAEEEIGAGARARLLRRLTAYGHDLVSELLAGAARPDEALTPAGRGLLYQLQQGLGVVEAAAAQAQLEALTAGDRERMKRNGVRFGKRFVYLRSRLDEPWTVHRAALLAAHAGAAPKLSETSGPSVQLARPPGAAERAQWLAMGYAVVERFALRVDALESLLDTPSGEPRIEAARERFGYDDARARSLVRLLQRSARRRRRRRARNAHSAGDRKG